ncbi:unnamed protein product [Closterium sp. Yama58-4]|nr:unnamed protein product [Closterium sp. Yama58-4]
MDLQSVIRSTDLEVLGIGNAKLFKMAGSFKFLFMLYLLCDVLEVLNNLNLKFQQREGFGDGQKGRLTTFLRDHSDPEKRSMVVHGVDNEGNRCTTEIPLHGEGIGGVYGTDIESCYALGKAFAEKLVSSLTTRLGDLEKLEGAKLFRPLTYPDRSTGLRDATFNTHLDKFLDLFDNKLPGKTIHPVY